MKVITMESSAYKEMMAQIANIAGYIREARDEKKRKRETEDKLLDTAQAAKMLNVSKRTMQRMRTDHRIEYVVVRGSCLPPFRDTAAIGGQHSKERGRDNRHPVPQPHAAHGRQTKRKEDIGHGTAHTKQLRGLDAEADGTARPSGRTAAGDEG